MLPHATATGACFDPGAVHAKTVASTFQNMWAVLVFCFPKATTNTQQFGAIRIIQHKTLLAPTAVTYPPLRNGIVPLGLAETTSHAFFTWLQALVDGLHFQ